MSQPIQNCFERYEKKYFLAPVGQKALLQIIVPYIKMDFYGKYTICNLYYDTPDWRLIRASLAKPVYKEKLRVRSYGVPAPDGKVFAELKKKYKGVVYKRRITDASHELKTPITVISTCLRVLEMETGKQKWIDKAQAQTEKLTALVNALVTLSRMDEGVSPLKMKPFPLSEAVADTAEPFRNLAQSKGHDLVLDIAPELTYKGDEYAIRQLVSILLNNAVKYARAGSAITLTLEKTRRGITLRCRNGSDPIPEDTLAKLFDLFYRADPARNAATGGFGIGLSIARSIAEAHKGSICARMVGEEVEFAAELR